MAGKDRERFRDCLCGFTTSTHSTPICQSSSILSHTSRFCGVSEACCLSMPGSVIDHGDWRVVVCQQFDPLLPSSWGWLFYRFWFPVESSLRLVSFPQTFNLSSFWVLDLSDFSSFFPLSLLPCCLSLGGDEIGVPNLNWDPVVWFCIVKITICVCVFFTKFVFSKPCLLC